MYLNLTGFKDRLAMSRWRCECLDTPKQKSLLEPGREAITEIELSGGRIWAKDVREPHRKHLGSMCMQRDRQTDRLGLPPVQEDEEELEPAREAGV